MMNDESIQQRKRHGEGIEMRHNTAQPIPDTEGEWRVSTYDESVILATCDARVIARCGSPAIAAQVLSDHEAAATHEDEIDNELRRWQDAIRDKLIDLGAPDHLIDGAGCDSGDPLDFTLAEVGQGVGYFLDQLELLRVALKAAGVEKWT
jgi:hypothetical protein